MFKIAKGFVLSFIIAAHGHFLWIPKGVEQGEVANG